MTTPPTSAASVPGSGPPNVRPALRRWHTAQAGTRLGVAAATGVLAGVTTSPALGVRYGVLVGWDALALVYLVWVWVTVARRDAAETAQLATREDPSRVASSTLLLGAAVASLFSVGLVLLGGGRPPLGLAHADLVLTVVSGVASWLVVHTSFCLHYARLYHVDPDHGIDFGQDAAPTYADFAYLAFTVGMTYQVSDTGVRTPAIRRAVLQHALLSFLFGTVVLSVSINLAVNLAR